MATTGLTASSTDHHVFNKQEQTVHTVCPKSLDIFVLNSFYIKFYIKYTNSVCYLRFSVSDHVSDVEAKIQQKIFNMKRHFKFLIINHTTKLFVKTYTVIR